MKEYANILASDKIIRWGTILSALITVIVLIYIGILYRSLPPVVPLYNQMPWGVDRLGSKPEFFILPGVALIILLMNSFLSALLYERMPLVARALTITCFLVSLITGIFAFRTIQLLL